MVFGEIIEPSTRALIDDECYEYPEDDYQPEIIWDTNFSVPEKIKTLVFIEHKKIIKAHTDSILKNANKFCALTDESVQICRCPNDKYIIIFNQETIAAGQMAEQLYGWIQKANELIVIVSEPLSLLNNVNDCEEADVIIRQLSNKKTTNAITPLTSPNLISGISGQIVSFIIHLGLEFTLYVIYVKSPHLDFINVKPLVELLKSLELPVGSVKLNLKSQFDSNLYL